MTRIAHELEEVVNATEQATQRVLAFDLGKIGGVEGRGRLRPPVLWLVLVMCPPLKGS